MSSSLSSVSKDQQTTETTETREKEKTERSSLTKSDDIGRQSLQVIPKSTSKKFEISSSPRANGDFLKIHADDITSTPFVFSRGNSTSKSQRSSSTVDGNNLSEISEESTNDSDSADNKSSSRVTLARFCQVEKEPRSPFGLKSSFSSEKKEKKEDNQEQSKEKLSISLNSLENDHLVIELVLPSRHLKRYKTITATVLTDQERSSAKTNVKNRAASKNLPLNLNLGLTQTKQSEDSQARLTPSTSLSTPTVTDSVRQSRRLLDPQPSQHSLYSPAFTKKRSSYVKEPSRPNIDIEKTAILTNKAKEYDKACKNYIIDEWRKKKDKPQITSEMVDESGFKYCKDDIDPFTQSVKQTPIGAWNTIISARTREVLDFVQNSGILIEPIRMRLSIMRRLLNAYIREQFKDQELRRTLFIEKLLTGLTSLLSLDSYSAVDNGLKKGKNIHSFLTALDEIGKPKLLRTKSKGHKNDDTIVKAANKKIVQVNSVLHDVKQMILMAFGDDAHAASEVVSALRKWSDTKSFGISLEMKMKQWCEASIKRSSIPYIVHQWIEKEVHNQGERFMRPLDKIKLSDCITSLYVESQVRKNLITINGKVFYSEANPRKFKCEEFFLTLFLALHTAEAAKETLQPTLTKVLPRKPVVSSTDVIDGQENEEKVLSPKNNKRTKYEMELMEIFKQARKKQCTINVCVNEFLTKSEEASLNFDDKLRIILEAVQNEFLPFHTIMKEIVLPLVVAEELNMYQKIRLILDQFSPTEAKRNLRIVRMMAMDGWYRAEQYIKGCFPKLNPKESPYSLKSEQGIETHVRVNQNDMTEYEVIEFKKYGVYKHINTQIKDQEDSQLALLPIIWKTQSPNKDKKWVCSFRIAESWKINAVAKEEEAEYITNALSDFTDINLLSMKRPDFELKTLYKDSQEEDEKIQQSFQELEKVQEKEKTQVAKTQEKKKAQEKVQTQKERVQVIPLVTPSKNLGLSTKNGVLEPVIESLTKKSSKSNF